MSQVAIYRDHCYWFVTRPGEKKDELGFVEAAKTCTDVGYFMADGVDRGAASFMRASLEGQGRIARGQTRVWIGATREEDRQVELQILYFPHFPFLELPILYFAHFLLLVRTSLSV